MASMLDRNVQESLAALLPEGFSWEELDSGQWASLLGGGALALFGLSRRSLTGLVLAGIGGRMAYKTIQEVMQHHSPQRPPDRGESTVPRAPRPGVVENRVDEASWESFPASDPPGNY